MGPRHRLNGAAASANAVHLGRQRRGRAAETRCVKRQEARDAKTLEEPAKELDERISELLAPIHWVQVRSYLKATGCLLGLLINFNVPVLVRGVRRIILTPDLASWRPGA